jgi:hypothetical protein
MVRIHHAHSVPHQPSYRSTSAIQRARPRGSRWRQGEARVIWIGWWANGKRMKRIRNGWKRKRKRVQGVVSASRKGGFGFKLTFYRGRELINSHGCNHMTCGRCGSHFCYRCGSSVSTYFLKDTFQVLCTTYAQISPQDPYAHYRKPGQPCFERLFDPEEILRFEREAAIRGFDGLPLLEGAW